MRRRRYRRLADAPGRPCGSGNSPYSSPSSFAGNPLLLTPEPLLESGRLKPDESPPSKASGTRVDFASVARWTDGWLHAAWRRYAARPEHREELREFRSANPWMEDWLLFTALRGEFGGRPWFEWPEHLRRRDATALSSARDRLAETMGFHTFVQRLFDRQWSALRRYANERGIRLIGDLPFYPAHDSADVWTRPELFDLDRDGKIIHGAGVPPDYFSEDGQVWNTPVFSWSRHREEGFRWWHERLRANLDRFDLLRLDHFRGYSGYWSIAEGAPTARDGRWEEGPGLSLFAGVEGVDRRLIAEDLGEIDPPVHDLRRDLGIPGMSVVQFLPEDRPLAELLDGVRSDTVLYTGTHDNDTTTAWLNSLPEDELRRRLPGSAGEVRPLRTLLQQCLRSPAELVVIPLQDWLERGGDSRMNVPGVALHNWEWRAEALPEHEQREFLRRLLADSQRVRDPTPEGPAGVG